MITLPAAGDGTAGEAAGVLFLTAGVLPLPLADGTAAETDGVTPLPDAAGETAGVLAAGLVTLFTPQCEHPGCGSVSARAP